MHSGVNSNTIRNFINLLLDNPEQKPLNGLKIKKSAKGNYSVIETKEEEATPTPPPLKFQPDIQNFDIIKKEALEEKETTEVLTAFSRWYTLGYEEGYKLGLQKGKPAPANA
jgi:hypothetical protein